MEEIKCHMKDSFENKGTICSCLSSESFPEIKTSVANCLQQRLHIVSV